MKGRMIWAGILGMSLFTLSAHTEVPPLMNYQGKLTNEHGVPVPNDDYEMRFCIYTDSTGGDSLWGEVQSSVTVRKGLFSVLLGSINPIPDTVFTGPTRWLGIRVPPDAEMTPREPIVSVGYAFKSHGAEVADSAVHADTADYALSATPDDDWVISGDTLIYREQGNVGIGTTSPGNLLDISTNTATHTNLLRLSNLQAPGYRAGIEFYTGSAGGSVGSTIEGSDYLIFKIGGFTLWEAMRISSNGKVGIGTTEPDEELHVVGNIKMVDGNQAAGKVLTSDANGVGSWQAGGIGGTYDSGWFPISAQTTYLKTHNLGTTKVIVVGYLAENSDGSGRCTKFSNIHEFDSPANLHCGTWIHEITTTTVTIYSSNRLTQVKREGEGWWIPTAAYARIILLALE